MKFLDIESKFSKYENSKFIVIPVPHEATTSYGQGTKNGPAAILKASQHVENFDEEMKDEPCKAGIHTLKMSNFKCQMTNVGNVLKDEKIPIVLGGEHSITPKVLEAFNNISVLQLDAHADLRDSYRGSKNSHACAMRRVLEKHPLVQVGIRSLSQEEWGYAKQSGQDKKIYFAKDGLPLRKILRQLSKRVYITIDLDVFDPAVLPGVGTPEPGGFGWDEIINFLRQVCQHREVVGFDVVELCPKKGDLISPFTAARLVYKMISYLT